MLSKKNIYNILFICVTHLGCMSHFRNQMKKGEVKGDELSFQSTSGTCNTRESGESSEEGEYSVDDTFYKINSFLRKNRLGLGFAITDDILDPVLISLSINKDIFNSYQLKEYKEFLNKYGSIRNTPLDIYKCQLTEDEELDDEIRKANIDKKVNEIKSTQILFHRSIKKRGRNEKNYWLIAKDQNIQYFINLEKNSNLGNVSYVDSSGKFVHCAKDFSDFLDEFLKKHEKSIQK